MKIRMEIIVIVFSLVLVTGIATTVVSETVSKNIIENQIYDHLETAAQSRMQHVETFLGAEKEVVKQLSGSVAIERFLVAEKDDEDYIQKYDDAMRRLRHAAEVREYARGVFVLDNNGTIVASREEADIGKDKSDNLYFLGGKEGVFVKDAYVSQDRKMDSIAFSAPVFDEEDNVFLGVVVRRVSMEALNKTTTDRTGLGETGEIYLVNKDGYMITSSRFVNDTFLKQKVNTENVRNCFEDVERFGEQEHEHEAGLFKNYLGTDVLGVHGHIPAMGWCMLAEISEKEAFAPITDLSKLVALILVGLSAAGILLSIVISGSIAAPIVKLHHGTEEIEKGNLNCKVGTHTSDEIGQLSRAFDSMTTKLKKSRDGMEEYSRGLETAVEERTEELNEKVREAEEQKIASLNLLEDVTETKGDLENAKEELEGFNRKLERSNKELQDFVYVASHDLREPMRKISTFGKLLEESLEGRLDEDEQENFEFMIDGATRMQQMIGDLLTYSRVTTKARPAEQVDLNKVIEDLKNVELGALLEETGGTIHISEPLLPVHADPSQVHQLLQNLIGNGLKYRRKGVVPEITLRNKQGDDNMVRVEVEDTGIGIDKEYYDQIFGMFRRLHPKGDYEGSGIGLAVCEKIVKRHGGVIGVESTPGVGSTFWFTLPKG